MAILFSYAGGDADFWRARMNELVPGQEFRVFPNAGDPGDVEFALVWLHPEGDLKNYPNLKAILSLAAGVEHILRDPDLPDGVPIVRLVDDMLAQDMALHVVHWVIHYHRNYHVYAGDQDNKRWQRLRFPDTAERRVGILGMGELGAEAARRVRDLGFAVAGWSRRPKAIEGVESFHGPDGLMPFLARTDILASLLPLTGATENLLDAEKFAAMPKGAFVINLSRGAILVDEDLRAALDSGHIAGAALDVFRAEPLPPDDPYWSHPKVAVTPHAAGPTNDRSAARKVAQNINRVLAGEAPHPVLDMEQRY
ncbi:MAG: glyoxylate/hydroxypyruvate reductase A [Rhodospirillales bacterium]|jgi:glyoxylate/hydroxypyruvate reductase A|nr:glyoxylate/hydroxypyruvate reductase A [Rhodospirillales bacterium]MDP6882710.1 glyoxylate/hydroxypyruvate reductase A [Rhodospirillales bacterium]